MNVKRATEINGIVDDQVARLRKRAADLKAKKESLSDCERLTLEVYAAEQSDRPNLRIAEIERLAKQLLDWRGRSTSSRPGATGRPTSATTSSRRSTPARR